MVSFYYYTMVLIRVGRPSGFKDFTNSEKNVILNCKHEYASLGLTNKQIREISDKRLGRNVHEITFRKVKNMAMQQELDTSQWLDQFSKHEIVQYYRSALLHDPVIRFLLIF